MFKWVGSKRRVVEDVISHFPDKVERYVEPFMGAAHVGLFLLKQGVRDVHFSDANQDLISYWKSVRDSPRDLLKEIEKYKGKLDERSYMKIRRLHPDTDVKRGARFYYLVKTSYRGLWRVNKNNEFNVAYDKGVNKDTFLPDQKEILDLSSLLQPASIEVRDFRDVLKEEHPLPTVFYMDPPYLGTFSAYAADKFTKHDHVVLAYHFHRLKRAGHFPVVSNIDHPFINDVYRDDNIYKVSIKHTTSCTAGAEDKIEVIVV